MTPRIPAADYNRLIRSRWSETTFQTQIVRAAWDAGWLVHHARTAHTPTGYRTPIQGNRGYPDLTLARRGRLIIAELKTETGTVDRNQRTWLEALTLRTLPNLGAAHVDIITGGTGILWEEQGDPDATRRLVALWRPRHWETITATLGTA